MAVTPEIRRTDGKEKPRYSPGLAFCRGDLVLILCIVLLALLPFATGKYLQARASADKSGLTAVLTVDGKEVWRQNLDDLTSEVTYTAEFGTGSMVICADESGAWVETSDCPDQICVHAGKLDKISQTAVCIPNRTVLRIVASDPAQNHSNPDTIDAVSGSCGGLYEKFFS